MSHIRYKIKPKNQPSPSIYVFQFLLNFLDMHHAYGYFNIKNENKLDEFRIYK